MGASRVRTAGQIAWAAVALACVGAVRLALGDAGLPFDSLMASAAALATWQASRRARRERSQRAWGLQFVAPLLWALAPVVWLTGGPPAVAGAARIAFLGFAAAGAWLTSHAGDPWSRVRLVVDGGLAAASVFVVGWVPAFHDAWIRAGGGPDGVAVVAAPLGAAWVATIFAGIAWTEMRGRHRVMPILYVAGMVVIAGSDVVWARGGTPLWAVGWGLLVLATWVYGGTSRRREVVSTRLTLTYAPYVLGAPAAIVLAVQGARGGAPGQEVGAAIAMVALLLVRQHVTLTENRALVRRLAATERELRHQATHDTLTGLPGRVVLWERLEELAEQRSGAPLAVMFVDLDDFKAINDEYGHAAGDHLLVELARRLTATLTPLGDGAVAVRMGGDEFALLLIGEAAERCADVAHRVLAAIEQPLAINGAQVVVGGSVGVASTDGDVWNPSALLRAADVAMYDVKHHGKSGVRVSDPKWSH